MKMPRVVSVVEGLLEHEAYGLMTQMLFKQVNTIYAHQSWSIHQDNSYHQNPNGATLTINIACKKSIVETGTLFVYLELIKKVFCRLRLKKALGKIKVVHLGNTLILPEKIY